MTCAIGTSFEDVTHPESILNMMKKNNTNLLEVDSNFKFIIPNKLISN